MAVSIDAICNEMNSLLLDGHLDDWYNSDVDQLLIKASMVAEDPIENPGKRKRSDSIEEEVPEVPREVKGKTPPKRKILIPCDRKQEVASCSKTDK